MLAELSTGIGGTALGVGVAVAAWIWRNTGKGNGKAPEVALVDTAHVYKDVCDERHGNLDGQMTDVKNDLKAVDEKVGAISTTVTEIKTIVTRNGGPK